MAKVYGDLDSILGGPQCFMQYMMLPKTTYEKLAEASATAVQGLQPKINVWEIGFRAESSSIITQPLTSEIVNYTSLVVEYV